MYEITGITNDYKQKLFLEVENFDRAEFTIYFKPNQYAWFFDLVWQDFSVKNQQLVMSPNILRQYRNIIPFGISCVNNSTIDPVVVEAFVLDTKLYFLDTFDVLDFEDTIYGS
jgi:hypothetical protein